MNKSIHTWPISKLEKEFVRIDFPEYQREPTVWNRAAKQRLIDSICRSFDISSLYLYQHKEHDLDCVDGRQRIGAILSFLNANPADVDDNGFPLKLGNEIYREKRLKFQDYDGKTFAEIERLAKKGEKTAKVLIETVRKYEVVVVTLSNASVAEEFNLQFARLNLGTIINSGEKLHAMVGRMRDLCFATEGLGQHAFLQSIQIPTRRYAKEQTATQIVAQWFAKKKDKDYTRMRYFDLQAFLMENAELTDAKHGWFDEVKEMLDTLAPSFKNKAVLRNRAMTVSTVLLALDLGVKKASAKAFAAFVEEFVRRLQWQVGKGLDADKEYRYLIDFQRHLTQASVEKPAVVGRARTLAEGYQVWNKSKQLVGDGAFEKRTGENPIELSAE